MLRKFRKPVIVLAATAAAVLSVALPAAAASHPAAKPAATPLVNCGSPTVWGSVAYPNNDFASGTSPYWLSYGTESPTGFCRSNVNGSGTFEQEGTSRCMIPASQSGGDVEEGNCADAGATWAVDNGAEGSRIRNLDTGQCIWDQGNARAYMAGCSASNPDDNYNVTN